MRLVFGHDALVAGWAANRIPHVETADNFGPMTAIGVPDDDGKLGAAAVYHGYQERFRGIEISFACDHPRYLSRTIISGLLRYPLAQLSCQRVTAATPRKATSTRQFLEKLGFRREGVMRRGFGNDDAVVYGLLAKEWARSPFNLDRRTDVPPLPVGSLRHGEKGQQRSTGSA
jgi:RimJ/RimL family protein N-acetyltransferase